MAQRLRNSRGQFMPIAAMVVFTIVVFIFAVINIYRVAKTKLRLQNIADAVALNLAAREASALNFIADRNEWMNHLYSNASLNTDPSLNANGACQDMTNDQTRLPGLSCVDRSISHFSFPSQTGAIGYARLVQSINDSQRLAAQAYDTFLGANPGVGHQALQNILLKDIPDLAADPSIKLITWNSNSGQAAANKALQSAQNDPANFFGSGSRLISGAEPLTKAFTQSNSVQDVEVNFDGKKKLTGTIVHAAFHNKFRELLKTSQPVGYMTVNVDNLPTLTLGNGSTSAKRIAAGAIVLKPVTIAGVTFAVSARSVAYVVPESGSMPVSGQAPQSGQGIVFRPTYWVKLVTAHG